MKNQFPEVGLEAYTKEKEFSELDAFIKEGRASLDDCVKKISDSIHKVFESFEDVQAIEAYEGSFGERLLAILNIIRGIMGGIDKVIKCKKDNSENKVYIEFLHLSLFFIRKCVWDVTYIIDKYCFGKRAIDGECCAHKYSSGEGKSSSKTSLIGRIMLALSWVDSLGHSIFWDHVYGMAPLCDLYSSMANIQSDIENLISSCIKSHFSSKECLESLSKDLEAVLDEDYENLKVVQGLLLNDENPNLEQLMDPLDKILASVKHLNGSTGWVEFRDSFRGIIQSIDKSLPLIRQIRSHVASAKEKIPSSSHENIMNKIDNIYKLTDGLRGTRED
jgi:hypothetical protein